MQSMLLPIMSRISSCTISPWRYPLAQLLPAPPPWSDRKMFSGLKRFLMSEFCMPLMTLHNAQIVLVPLWYSRPYLHASHFRIVLSLCLTQHAELWLLQRFGHFKSYSSTFTWVPSLSGEPEECSVHHLPGKRIRPSYPPPARDMLASEPKLWQTTFCQQYGRTSPGWQILLVCQLY